MHGYVWPILDLGSVRHMFANRMNLVEKNNAEMWWVPAHGFQSLQTLNSLPLAKHPHKTTIELSSVVQFHGICTHAVPCGANEHLLLVLKLNRWLRQGTKAPRGPSNNHVENETWLLSLHATAPLHVLGVAVPVSGMEKISWGSLLSESYDILWKSIIRPPRLRVERCFEHCLTFFCNDSKM